MKIYIIAATIGTPDLNRPLFDEITNDLRSRGITVVNLHELYEGQDVSGMNRREFMSIRINALLSCDSFVMPDPSRSDAACDLEFLIAKDLELNRIRYSDLLKMPLLESQKAEA